jgi:hypothetical protein
VRGWPVVSSHFSPGAAPQVGQRTASICFWLMGFFMRRDIIRSRPDSAGQSCSFSNEDPTRLGSPQAFTICRRWPPLCLVDARKIVTFVLVEGFLHVKQRFAGHDLTGYDPRACRTSPGSEGAVFQPQQCSRHDLIFPHLVRSYVDCLLIATHSGDTQNTVWYRTKRL